MSACLGEFASKNRRIGNGDNRPNLKEPSLVRLNYELIWMKRKIDLSELAKLRESGLSLREIQKITGFGKTTISRNLKKLRCINR